MRSTPRAIARPARAEQDTWIGGEVLVVSREQDSCLGFAHGAYVADGAGVDLAGGLVRVRRPLAEASTGVEMGPLTRHRLRPYHPVRHGAIVQYASWMSPPATLLIWFKLRSPELAHDFERLMTEDRDIVRSSLDTVSDWRLTRPADVPGQSVGQADYVLIAEILEVERFEQQASEHVQRLADDLAHLVSRRGMLVVRSVL